MADSESTARTLAVAAGVALFCSLIVSSAVVWLRPYQLAYRAIEQNRAVLEAAGVVEPEENLTDRDIASRFVSFDVRVIDLDAGTYTNSALASVYDYRRALDDPGATKAIAPEFDTAGLGRRPILMPVYLRFDRSRVERVVLPIYGRGMWSTIHGFVGLGPDIATATGVSFYEHGETPGIGDRIENIAWRAQWRGLPLYDDEGRLTFRIGTAADNTATPPHIDAITGATVTVSAIERFVGYWLGRDGYGPFLATLRSEVP